MSRVKADRHSVPYFPEEDTKLRASSLTVRRGGNCPNSLEVLGQLLGPSVRSYLVAALPDASSPATHRIQASLPGTDLSHCIYRTGKTEAASCTVIRSEATNSRTIVSYRELPEMTAGEFEGVVDAFAGREETWWHFEVRLVYRRERIG